ncbi:LytR C-terminal domain-containing protein [Candidatus Microgenomates bacterium]|nr:LytR C-terminal domain-containing protein [Candidatus Microgenomates bacterium]
MEEQYQQQPQAPMINDQVPPQPIKKNKGGMKWLLIVILLLLIAGVAGFFLTQSQKEEEPTPEPTTFVEETLPTETPSSTSSPKPADKSKVSIEVQNGTGIPGEAGFLQDDLKKLGYTKITVGNAETQDATTTTIVFGSTVSSDVKDELTNELKTLYKSVETKTSSTLTKTDILITTGLRKNATAKPSGSATPKASSSPTATAKPSSSPTTP